MKLLDVSQLAELSNYLSGDYGDVRLDVRLEAYSCKMAGDDKRAFKQLSSSTNVDELETLAPSPSTFSMNGSPLLGGSVPKYSTQREVSSSLDGNGSYGTSTSPLAHQQQQPHHDEGTVHHKCSIRTLYYLKSTLNAVFSPDYDFTNARSHEFSKEPSFPWAQRTCSVNMRTAMGDEFDRISSTLWREMEDAIVLDDCDIYSYNPDLDSDPFGSDGVLWSFNYFFYNKKLKRILFFRGRAVSNGASYFDDDLDTMSESGDDGLASMEL